MHGELVNAVHTAARCQMCVLEHTWRNGKTVFIKTQRNDIRMSCTEHGLSHSTCQAQTCSVGLLTPKPQVSLSGAVRIKLFSIFLAFRDEL